MQTNRTAERSTSNGGPGGGGGGGDGKFGSATVQRIAATAATGSFAAEPTRAYFLIVNESLTDLFVSMDLSVDSDVGDEHGSIVLPGGVSAGFQLDGYTGPISFKYANGDDSATGYALVTRGYEP